MTTSAPDSVRGEDELLGRHRIVAVLRAADSAAYEPVIEVLVAGGVHAIELTLTTPGTLERLPELSLRQPSAVLGVGTVTSAVQAESAIERGARYLVTPALDLEVIAVARAAGVPVYPGALTPTEVLAAWRAGASAVKIFPAETVGPRYGGHLRGPFPDLRFIPSGGVSLDDVPAWFEAGASAVSLGGPLIGDALSGGSLDALAERCRDVVRRADTQVSIA